MLSGSPPFAASELLGMSRFADEMTIRAKKLTSATHQLAKCSPMYLDWLGPAADQYSTLLTAQIRKLEASARLSLDARDAALAGLAEAKRINEEWTNAVEAYWQAHRSPS